jgi:hypothetical protein
MTLTKTFWRVLTASGALAFCVGGLGLLHAPFAKPLLATLGGGCPVGNVSPSVVEAARRDAIRATRGSGEAKTRPALGFALDEMTLERVRAWARAANVRCDEKREGTVLKCTDVPASALLANAGASDTATIDDITFGFSIEGKRLVNVTTLRSNLVAHDAAARMRAIVSALAATLGEPTTAAGEATPELFERTPFATAAVSYKFHDYLADVSSTAIPGRGVVLREHYMSARL